MVALHRPLALLSDTKIKMKIKTVLEEELEPMPSSADWLEKILFHWFPQSRNACFKTLFQKTVRMYKWSQLKIGRE